jgi:hypothetical protein
MRFRQSCTMSSPHSPGRTPLPPCASRRAVPCRNRTIRGEHLLHHVLHAELYHVVTALSGENTSSTMRFRQSCTMSSPHSPGITPPPPCASGRAVPCRHHTLRGEHVLHHALQQRKSIPHFSAALRQLCGWRKKFRFVYFSFDYQVLPGVFKAIWRCQANWYWEGENPSITSWVLHRGTLLGVQRVSAAVLDSYLSAFQFPTMDSPECVY